MERKNKVEQFFFRKDCRAMSTVLATVIILGITVAMGALVWGVVNNLIGKNLEQSQSCFGVLDQVKLDNDYMCYNPTLNRVQFSINVGDIDIDEILISVSFSGNSKSATLTKDFQIIDGITNYATGTETCFGTATACFTFTSPSTCAAQSGCTWIGAGFICTGTAIPCPNFISTTSCQSQKGCTWPIGVKMPGKNSGATYFFEGITANPTSVSIIPIIKSNQCGVADSVHRLDDCAALVN